MQIYVHEGLTIAYEKAVLFDGVREVIDGVRSAGMKTGLVTSSPRLQVSAALARLGIDDVFDTVVTGDDIVNYKPHPEPVLLALDNLGEPAESTLFVGDYIYDVQAGSAAGTSTALFLPDRHAKFYDFDELRSTGPDHVFVSYDELGRHLGV
jgi:pyrophosphatase PpaX